MPRRMAWRGLVGVRSALVASSVLVALAGWVAARDLSRSGEAQEWVRHTRDVLATASSAATALDRAETAQRGYLLVGDTAYLPVGMHADRTAAGALAALRRLTMDNPRQQRRLDTLEVVLPRRLAGIARTVRTAQAGDRAGAVAMARAELGPAGSDAIRALIDGFVGEEQQLLRERMELRELRSQEARREMLVALLLAVGTAAWAVYVLGRAMDRQAAARASLRGALATTEASEARYRLLFTALPRPAWVYDRETLRFLAVNPAAVAQYGYDEAEFLALRITDIRPPEEREAVVAIVHATGEAPLAARHWRHFWKDGSLRDVVVSTHALEYAGRSARLAVIDDVTDRLQAERTLRGSEARFRAAMTGMRDAFLVLRASTGPDGAPDLAIVEVNAAAARLLDAAPAASPARRTVRALVPGERGAALLELGRRVLETGRPFEGDHDLVGARTGVAWVRLHVFPLEGETEPMLAVILRDITARKRAEAQLRDEAHRDALTGLLNRRGLEDAVVRRLGEAGSTGQPDVLLYLDLDAFKPINDSFGHATGDEALRTVADVLRRSMRAGDAIARLGGDEFVVYAPAGPEGAGARDLVLLADRVRHALGAENARAAAAGRRYTLHASIGGAVVEGGDTLASLLARGDAALYAEKSRRRARRVG